MTTVEQHLEKIRHALGVTHAKFATLTMREVQQAQARTTWCAQHGGLRDAGCDWCSYLDKVEAGR